MPTKAPTIRCPVCASAIRVGTSTSKAGHVALVLVCPLDGRHFRGFINHKAYVSAVLDSLASRKEAPEA